MPADPDKRSNSIRLAEKVAMERVFVGPRFTTLKHGELSRRVLAAMLRQLNINRRDF